VKKRGWILALTTLSLGGLLLWRRKKVHSVGGHRFEDAPKELTAENTPAGTSGVIMGEFFTLPEFVASNTASREGIDNTPTPQAIVALRALTQGTLDPLRRALGKPVRITSGFRSPELNDAIDGSLSCPTGGKAQNSAEALARGCGSQQLYGQAVDIMVTGMLGKDLAKRMLDLRDQGAIDFDQIVWYHKRRHPHVHVSFKSSGNRRKITYAPQGGGYEHGVDPRATSRG